MTVLLYAGSLKLIEKSGVGMALRHQQQALAKQGITYTLNNKDPYEIIHINTILPDAYFASKKAKKKGKKVIYYAHSTMEDFRNSFRGSNFLAPLFKRWIIRCYNSGNIIITPTDYSKRILESYGVKKPIYVLSNGIDTASFSANWEARKRFRKKYNIDEKEKVVISVGHYIHRKGIMDFIALAKRLPQYQFYWFGHTDLNLIPAEIKAAIKTPLANLHFPAYITNLELRDAYCGSDLFLFLTHEETEGIVLLEALASKTPVLVRDIPIYKTWLVENEVVYKGRTLKEFEKKIQQILTNELPDITDAGLEKALERDLKVIGKKLAAIYQQIEK